MQRVCSLLKVRPDHDAWPEMLAALTAAGRHNYSLFLRPDGLLVGDFTAARARMTTLGAALIPLDEVFHSD